MLLKLVSYNIHKGIGGVDRLYRPERIVETLAHYEPDVVFLQEVDDGVPRSRHDRQVDWIGDRLGLEHRLFQGNVRLKEGCYGNAILSRHALADTASIELTVPPKKRRRGLFARIQVHHEGHSRTIALVNVHLGLAGVERSIQVRRLLKYDTISRIHRDTPFILGGDFNDSWGQLGRKLLLPQGFASAIGNYRTFPAAYPLLALDRLYYRGEIDVDHGFPGHTDVARQASDHLPLVVHFRLLEP